MPNGTTARQHFRALVLPTNQQPALAETALAIAWEDTGVNHIAPMLAMLDDMAQTLSPAVAERADPYAIVGVLNEFMFEQFDLHGNRDDYTDPQNSYLDHVLTRRTGLPLLLSIIYMEIGWRLALPISGVALPGHFLTRFATPHEDIYIDPFRRGRLWSYQECVQQIQNNHHHVTERLVTTIMQPPDNRSIVLRLLRNLKHAYLNRRNFAHSHSIVDRMLIINPHDPIEIRDRGLIALRLGWQHRALADLEQYAHLAPTADDLPLIQQHVQQLAETIARSN